MLPAIAGVLVAFALWNLAVAALLWRPTGYVFDDARGRVYRPGLYVHGVEGFSWSRIGPLGLRELGLAGSESSTPTVLFLGDSLTEAFQVGSPRTFAALVPERVSTARRSVRGVNAGHSGDSPATYVGLSDWYQAEFRPRVTVVQLSDADFAEAFDASNSAFYLRRTDSGSFEVVRGSSFRSANPLLQRFPALSVAMDVPVLRLGAENVRKIAEQRKVASPFRPASAVAHDDTGGKVDIPDPREIDWVVRELSARYDHVVLLYLPERDWLNGPTDASAEEAEVSRAARRYGVRLVDMRDAFSASAREGRMPVGFANTTPGIGHLNSTGHELAADALAPVVAEELSQ